MTRDKDQLTINSVLREYRFASSTPVIGPLIARLRLAWYNVAAHWGDQFIIAQQTAYNQAATQRIIELEQRISELDQCLILADHDLSNLTRTVAELTQQLIQLQRKAAAIESRQVKADD
jgi:hypothetical protein